MNDKELQRMYENRFVGQREYRLKVWRTLNRDFFKKWIHPGDTVLDLGAGHAEFINTIVCKKKYAMDLNPDTARFAGPEVEVLAHDCSSRWPLPDASLDVVFTSNFFEHLPDRNALARTLSETRRCLKPGGRLIAMGPNIKYVRGAYWDFIDHYIPLTENSLAEALRNEGFKIERCIPRFLPYTMVGGPNYPTFFIALYLALPFAWRIFGKQFFIVAEAS